MRSIPVTPLATEEIDRMKAFYRALNQRFESLSNRLIAQQKQEDPPEILSGS